MNFINLQTVKITSYLLLALAAIQILFTASYVAEINLSRQFVWGLESLLFTFLAVFAGAALVQTKRHQVVWSAIAFSAVFNLIQVSIGLTMFGPFREAANNIEGFGSVAGAVVALSFMIYYAAKLLLGFAALMFGIAKMAEGAKVLGSVTALVGAIAMAANMVLLTFGRDAFLHSGFAGTSGVLATLLLALCLMRASRED